MKKISSLFVCIFVSIYSFALPSISSFLPLSGAIGSNVTIYGRGFSAILSENKVQIGVLRANVTGVTDTSVTATIPAGAGSNVLISVIVNGLTVSTNNLSTPYFKITGVNSDYPNYIKNTISTDRYPNSIATGDFNSDGNVDFVLANYGDAKISIYSGNGNGVFTGPSYVTVGLLPTAISVNDIDGNGYQDIVVTNNASNSITILRSLGNGTFLTNTISLSVSPNDLKTADVNSDGKVDILFSSFSNNCINVLLGNGDGTFSTANSYTVGTNPSAIVVGDFDGDFKLDIATSNYSSNSITLFKGNNDGTFTNYSTLTTDTKPSHLVLHDMNLDGFPDLLVTYSTLNKVIIYQGSSNGTFSLVSTVITATMPLSVIVTDCNNDNYLDLCVLNKGSNNITIYRGVGDGTYMSNEANISTSTNTQNFIVGDFDKNGEIDFVFSNYSDSTICIMLNKTLLAPVAVVATNITTSSFTANWNAVEGANGYLLDISTNSAFSTYVPGYKGKDVKKTLLQTITGLTSGITYYYRVWPYITSGIGLNSNTITTTIIKKDQTITFNTIPNKFVGNIPFSLTATGGASGNPIIFTSSDTLIAKCGGTNGSTISIISAGSCTIYANQAGNISYNVAPQVSQTLTVIQCIVPTTATISMNPVSGTECAGGTVTLTSNSQSQPMLYKWYSGSVSSGTLVKTTNNVISDSYSLAYLNTGGQYTLLVSDPTYPSASQCWSQYSVTVTSNSLPNIVVTASVNPVNLGSQTTLMATGAGTGGTYVWSNSSTMSSQIITPTITSLYLVTGTNSNGCKSATYITVTVTEPTPIPAYSPVGSGTMANPYKIATVNNLYWLSQNSSAWSSYFIQTADIDATELASNNGFLPIGNMSVPFRGFYDGQNHTISNLKINRSTVDYIGLFGYTNRSKISNLGLINVNISGKNNVGSLIGYQYSLSDTIKNCYSSGIVTGVSNSGGLIGCSNGLFANKCFAQCTVSAYEKVGGFIGNSIYNQANNTNISECFATGSVSGSLYLGGFIGMSNNNTRITNCYATGSVTGNGSCGGCVGGFTGSDGEKGGLNYMLTTNCYAIGKVNSGSTSYCRSGFVGGTFINSSQKCVFNTESTTATLGSCDYNNGWSTFTALTNEQMKTQSNFTALGWDFVAESQNGLNDYWNQNELINNGFPYLNFQTNVWNGTGSISNTSNWSAQVIPTITSVIIVENGELIIDRDISTVELIVKPGAKLTINPMVKVEIINNINIKSDVTGTGTFVDNGTVTVNGTTTVQQYLTGSGTTTPNGRFWYISSPVTGATSATFDAAGTNVLKRYEEPNHVWSEITDNTTTLPVGTGYFTRLGATTTATFTGTLNTGDITVIPTRSGSSDEKRGFNLVGNPYPSFLNWDDVEKTNIQTTMWYRSNNGLSMVFDTYNSVGEVGTDNNGNSVNKFIPPMQAFWVRVSNDGDIASLTFKNTMRSHQTGNVLKSNTQNDIIRLKVSNGTNSDEAIVVFNTDATNGIDVFDSEKMSNNDASIPELYTVANSQKLVINGLESAVSNPIIPLGFKTAKAGTYTITAKAIEGLDGVPVILEDKLLNVKIDLTQTTTYSFLSDSVDNANRFVLRLKACNETTFSEDLNSTTAIIVKNHIIEVTTTETEGVISVYDLLGRVLEIRNIEDTKTILAMPNTVCFVKVQTASTIEIKKIVK